MAPKLHRQRNLADVDVGFHQAVGFGGWGPGTLHFETPIFIVVFRSTVVNVKLDELVNFGDYPLSEPL